MAIASRHPWKQPATRSLTRSVAAPVGRAASPGCRAARRTFDVELMAAGCLLDPIDQVDQPHQHHEFGELTATGLLYTLQ
jgi:hypothetical protein